MLLNRYENLKLSAIILLSSMLAVPFVSGQEASRILIRIVNVPAGEIPGDFDFDLTFEVRNETDSAIWVPNPKVTRDEKVSDPDFFSITIHGAECSAGFVDLAETPKSLDEFTEIKPHSAIQFTVNPFVLNMFPICEFNEDETHKIQVLYLPDKAKLSEDFIGQGYSQTSDLQKVRDVYSKIPMYKILSDPLEVVVKR